MDANFKLINVNEKMPEKDGYYLVLSKTGFYSVVNYSCEHGQFNTTKFCNEYAKEDVVYWANIPDEYVKLSDKVFGEYMNRICGGTDDE